MSIYLFCRSQQHTKLKHKQMKHERHQYTDDEYCFFYLLLTK